MKTILSLVFSLIVGSVFSQVYLVKYDSTFIAVCDNKISYSEMVKTQDFEIVHEDRTPGVVVIHVGMMIVFGKNGEAFIEDVRAKTGGELKPGDSFRRKITDDNIKLKAVYGLDQKVGNYGINNCQVILQGPIELKLDETDNTYLVEANHKVINPDLPKDDYEPYMYVTFRSDRNNEGVKNARFGTYPEAYKRNAPEI
jgi:hypothetical protein